MMQKIKTYVVHHKVFSGVLGIIVICGGYVLWSRGGTSAGAATYIFAPVTRGALVSSISGSGQVAAENQVTITSTVSGDVNAVLVSSGDEVKKDQIIAVIEGADALRAVKNAELSLENAQVSYDKAKKQAADQIPSSSTSDLSKAYEAGYNAIVSTSIDLPIIFGGVNDMYYSSTHSPYFSDVNISAQASDIAVGYKLQAGAIFDEAKAEYNANFLRYKNIGPNSSASEISSLLHETNVILKKLLSALSGTYSTVDFIQGKLSRVPTELTSDKTALTSYVSKVNAASTAVTNALTDIDDAQTSGTTADLSMKSAELAVNQAEAALLDAQKALADHKIRAPFDGLIAKVSAKVGDKVSNGTPIAIIVTARQIVNISLNEIDAAKVEKGNTTSLTFDAIDGLTLAGHVSNVDLVGTVSQGVVSYSVEIFFDDIDARVKPGMTVNANIITKAKDDVLLVPSSAVKTQSGKKYVQISGTTTGAVPVNKYVKIGDSNDTSTEIISGLKEGDRVVVKTVTTAKTVSTTPSILNSIGGNRASGAGAARTLTR